MATMSYEAILKKISDEKGMSIGEIEVKIKEKLAQLSDLISKDGAAHIVANELGVKVYETPINTPKKININELNPIYKNIQLLAKVLKMNEIRSFKTAAREGRVANIFIGDETGTCRLVVWDEKLIKQIEGGFVKEGDLLKLEGCYIRDNNFGGKEVHMGSQAIWVVNPVGESLGEVKQSNTINIEEKQIKDLVENDNACIIGTIVQIFEPRFYDSCPQCNKKVEFRGDCFYCGTHGKVESIPQPILNFVFDDGTENIRVSCFRDVAKQVLDCDDVVALKENAEMFREIQRKVAGRQLKIRGRVNMNTFFNRIEFNANSVEEADPKALAMKLKN